MSHFTLFRASFYLKICRDMGILLVQENVLGVPLLFNMFLCDIFFIMNEIGFARYVNDITPYETTGTGGNVNESPWCVV